MMKACLGETEGCMTGSASNSGEGGALPPKVKRARDRLICAVDPSWRAASASATARVARTAARRSWLLTVAVSERRAERSGEGGDE
jgi:hypothetical protein